MTLIAGGIIRGIAVLQSACAVAPTRTHETGLLSLKPRLDQIYRPFFVSFRSGFSVDVCIIIERRRYSLKRFLRTWALKYSCYRNSKLRVPCAPRSKRQSTINYETAFSMAS